MATRQSSQATAGTAPVTTMFQGYDTFMNSGMSTAVQGKTGPVGAIEQCYYTVCTSYSQVKEALSISSSASGMFGVGSIGAKSSFAESLKITTYSVSIVVYTNIVTRTDVNLLAGISTLNLDEFFAVHGDSFISACMQGAEYMAAYVFYAQSQEEQESMVNTLGGYGIIEGDSFSDSTQESFSEAQENINTSQYFKQLITGFDDLPLPSPDDVVSFALTFGTKTPDAPAVISFQTQGYENVPGVTNFSPIVTNRQLFLGTPTAPGLSGDLASLGAVNNQIEQIEQIYATYGYNQDSELSQRAKQVTTDINALTSLVNEINADPAGNYQAGTYPSLGYGSPELKFQLGSSPVWGGNGGGPFQDITPQSISGQWTLSSLLIWGGAWVNELTTTYQSPNQNQGNQAGPFQHGEHDGSESQTLYLQSGEFITSISGMAGEYVNQLIISIPKNPNFTWPPSPQQASPFSWNVPSGSVVVGFSGRSGKYLDQLEAVYCTFSPAVWSG